MPVRPGTHPRRPRDPHRRTVGSRMSGRPAEELADVYLDALRRADLDAMVGLFRDGATVHSPLYGPIPAVDFYPRLFSDTTESRLALRGVAGGVTTAGAPLVLIWVSFDWRLQTVRPAPFDVVDIAELAGGRRIGRRATVLDGGWRSYRFPNRSRGRAGRRRARCPCGTRSAPASARRARRRARPGHTPAGPSPRRGDAPRSSPRHNR